MEYWVKYRLNDSKSKQRLSEDKRAAPNQQLEFTLGVYEFSSFNSIYVIRRVTKVSAVPKARHFLSSRFLRLAHRCNARKRNSSWGIVITAEPRAHHAHTHYSLAGARARTHKPDDEE